MATQPTTQTTPSGPDEKGRPLDVLMDIDGTRPPADYVPEGFDSVEEFLEDLREQHSLDLDYDRENREEALSDKEFTAGEQWDKKVLEHRKGLPNLLINTVPQFTAQLVGDWRAERPGIKVIPAEDGDVDVADIRGDLVRSIEMKSRAERIFDSAFESMVQCGDGAFRVAVEYTRDDVFDQDITLKPIDDCLSVVWDRFSIDPTGKDARHVFVDDSIPLKEFERKWPEEAPSSLSDSAIENLRVEGWIDSDFVKVTEYWRIIERDRLLVMFEDGAIIAMDEIDDLGTAVEQHGPPVRSRVAPCSYAQMHLVTGFTILSGPYEYKMDRVPIVRMTGRVVNVGGRRVRYGLVRFMKDPVRLRNFWRSQAAEQLGYAPKATWIAPESAVEGREDKLRQAHLSRDPLIVYNDGAERPPELIPPPPMQAALLNEAATNAQDMKDVTGIHDASLGIRSNETSGKAINARKMEGDIASLTYYDNGNAAILEAGDVINQLIPQIYDGTRIIRIIGEDQETKFLRINDPYDPNSVNLATGHYDVALSTGPSFTTRREAAAEAMMNAIQVWPELMGIAGDLVVKAQNWPAADKLADRLQKAIPPHFLEDEDGAPQPDPAMVQQLQQLEMAVQQLSQENEQLKTDKTIEIEKLKIDEYNAQTQRLRALSDHHVDNTKLNQDAMRDILAASNEPPVR